jgi:hypothetical protein
LDNINGQIANATKHALREIANRPKSLTIIRNGGWEQWLRNHFLIQLDRRYLWGVTESSSRADLVLTCGHCYKRRAALEVKTNFIRQPASEIHKRLGDAIAQLEKFRESKLPSFIVYNLTHLRGTNNALVKAQNHRRPGYKHFDEQHQKWHQRDDNVFGSIEFIRFVTPPQYSCVAELRTWIALVQNVRSDDSKRRLLFLNSTGTVATQIWRYEEGAWIFHSRRSNRRQ